MLPFPLLFTGTDDAVVEDHLGGGNLGDTGERPFFLYLHHDMSFLSISKLQKNVRHHVFHVFQRDMNIYRHVIRIVLNANNVP